MNKLTGLVFPILVISTVVALISSAPAKINAVVKAGKLIDRTQLDSLLEPK